MKRIKLDITKAQFFAIIDIANEIEDIYKTMLQKGSRPKLKKNLRLFDRMLLYNIDKKNLNDSAAREAQRSGIEP